MNLHLVQDSPFINTFIDTCSTINNTNNEFIILRPPPYEYLNAKHPIKHLTIKEISTLTYISNYTNIYFHGFGGDRFTFVWCNYFKFLYLKFLKKKPTFIWLFFGYEFYGTIKQRRSIDVDSISTYLKEINFNNFNLKVYLQRKLIFKEIDFIGHFIPEEIDLLKSMYSIKAELIPFFYGSNFISFQNIEFKKELNTIIFGNSATYTNNHIEGAKKIQKIKTIQKVFVPLSYGSKKYSSYISRKLKVILDGKFLPFFEFLNFKKYLKLLSSVDAGVFNYYRSQGMGNIIQLILLGKPIFLNPKNPAFHFFEQLGVKIGNINHIENEIISFNIETLSNNKSIVLDYFSDENRNSFYRDLLSIQ
jgi:hypothetical protein